MKETCERIQNAMNKGQDALAVNGYKCMPNCN